MARFIMLSKRTENQCNKLQPNTRIKNAVELIGTQKLVQKASGNVKLQNM